MLSNGGTVLNLQKRLSAPMLINFSHPCDLVISSSIDRFPARYPPIDVVESETGLWRYRRRQVYHHDLGKVYDSNPAGHVRVKGRRLGNR